MNDTQTVATSLMMGESEISAFFPVRDCEAVCRTFELSATPGEKLDGKIYCQTTNLPDVISRIIFDMRPDILCTVTPSLGSSLYVTIFECVQLDMIKKVIDTLKKYDITHLKFTYKEINEEFDTMKLRSAYENYIMRNLESTYIWGFISKKTALYNANTGYAVINPTLNARVVESSQILCRASLLPVAKKESHAVYVGGNIKSYNVVQLTSTLSKKYLKMLEYYDEVRLEPTPCYVLPNNSVGYAVHISNNLTNDLKEYWKFVHGIEMKEIKTIIMVTFIYESENVTLEYPAQCVFHINSYIERPTRKSMEGILEFKRLLLADIRSTVASI